MLRVRRSKSDVQVPDYLGLQDRKLDLPDRGPLSGGSDTVLSPVVQTRFESAVLVIPVIGARLD